MPSNGTAPGRRAMLIGRATRWLLALGGVAVLGAGGAWAFVRSGVYDISATRQHTQAVYSLLETTMHYSVRQSAASIEVPPLDSDALVARGAACYVQKCVQCHGGPGVAQSEIGRSMQPLPGPLVDARGKWSPSELYWITRNGIKMSGMPAWRHHLADADIWAVVAFMQKLPDLTTVQFREEAVDRPGQCSTSDAANGATAMSPAAMPAPNRTTETTAAERGRRALTQYACSACHRIPGVTGADVAVGPPLAGHANRLTIAGAVVNDREWLIRWIRDPQGIDPKTTMPDMRVGEKDAADMADYLLTLR